MRKSSFLFISFILLQFFSSSLKAQRNIDLMIFKAQQMIMNNDYLEAIKSCNEIITVKPYLYEPYFLRGVSKFYLEDFKGANNDLTKAIEIKPNSTSAYHYRALSRERIYDFDGSLQDFGEAIRQSPNDPQLYINRAITFLYLNQYYDAIGNCNIAIRIDPNIENTYMIRGAAKTGLDHFIEALDDYNKTIKINRFNHNAYLRRGMIRFELEDIDGALLDFNESIGLNPENSFAYFNRAMVYAKQNNYDSALTDLNTVINIDPKNSLSYFNRAMIYTDMGELDNAISDYSMVVQYNKDNLLVYFNRGNLYMQKKEYSKAVKDYSEAIRIYPDFADAYANRSVARSQLKQNDLATLDYDIARQLKEEHYSKTHEELVAEEDKIQSLIEFEAEFFQSEKEKQQLQNKEFEIDLLQDFSILWNIKNDASEYYDFRLNQIGSKMGIKIDARMNYNELSENDVRNKIDSLENVLIQFPESVKDWYLHAVLNTEIKNYHVAIGDYDQIIQLDSNFAPAYLNKGVIQSKLALMYNAFNNSQSGSFLVKDQPEYSSEGNDASSIINNFKKAQQLIPDLPYSYYNLANIYCKQLEYNKGLEYYDKAIEINPDMGEAYYNKGITMIYLGDTDNGCFYIGKSGELGVEEAYSVLKRYCNK